MFYRLSQSLKAITCVMAFLMPGGGVFADQHKDDNSAQTNPSHNVYLSLANEFGAPTTEKLEHFDCSDKIYVVAELSHYPVGEHQLSVKWIDPNQTTRETTNYPFFVRQSSTRIWAWLSLSRGAGAGILQWIDPAAGLEEFIGEWKGDLRINGKQIAENRFEVNC